MINSEFTSIDFINLEIASFSGIIHVYQFNGIDHQFNEIVDRNYLFT